MHKIPLPIKLLIVLFILVSLLTWQAYQGITHLSDNLTQQTEANLRVNIANRVSAETQVYAEQIADTINTALQTTIDLGKQLEDAIQDTDNKLTRNQVDNLTLSLLKTHSEVDATYAEFEANGFDGRDNEFIGTDKIHSIGYRGSLEVYWLRTTQGLEAQEVYPDNKYRTERDEHGTRQAEWYLCPKEQQVSCIVEPYLYEAHPNQFVLLTSLTTPILVNNSFRGITGVDIPLARINDLVKELGNNLYQGQAQVTLVSKKGLIIASTQHPNEQTKKLSQINPSLNQAFNQLTSQQNKDWQNNNLYIKQEVKLNAPSNQWSLIVSLPEEVALAQLIQMQEIVQAEKTKIISYQLISGFILSIIAIIAINWLFRGIKKPIAVLNRQLDELNSSSGNLSQRLDLSRYPDLAPTGKKFNDLLTKLEELVLNLQQIGSSVRVQIQKNADTSQTASATTNQQQVEIDFILNSSQQLLATAEEVAELSNEISNHTEYIDTEVNLSKARLTDAIHSSRQLSKQMTRATESIQKVAEQSREVTNILTVINDISDQTNLLALNAAIEASRAGEQGRGFAVVADEVRALASRTQEATAEVETMLDSLQQEVTRAVNLIENSSNQATTTKENSQQADESLTHVVEKITSINNMITQAATAANQQSSLSNEVNMNLSSLNESAISLAGLGQEVNSTSKKVDKLVNKLENNLAKLHQ